MLLYTRGSDPSRQYGQDTGQSLEEKQSREVITKTTRKVNNMHRASNDRLVAKREFMERVRRWLAEVRFRYYLHSVLLFDWLTTRQIESLGEISSERQELVLQSFETFADQVLNELTPETLHLIGEQLELVKLFCLTRYALLDNETIVGLTREFKNGFCIAVALQVKGIDRNRYSIASTLFHELMHTTLWFDNKVNIDEYYDIYDRYFNADELDSFTKLGRDNDKEAIIRVFQGALFGIQQIAPTAEELERGVRSWQQAYPEMLHLALRDPIRVFSTARYQKVETRGMTVSRTMRMVPKELLYKRTIFCRYDEEPSTYSDLIYRGTLLWLREQAKQAENDPDSEWLGLRHEFDLFQSGNHPDPHPERSRSTEAEDYPVSPLPRSGHRQCCHDRSCCQPPIQVE